MIVVLIVVCVLGWHGHQWFRYCYEKSFNNRASRSIVFDEVITENDLRDVIIDYLFAWSDMRGSGFL